MIGLEMTRELIVIGRPDRLLNFTYLNYKHDQNLL